MKHGSKKGRKRKKQIGNNKDKSNAAEGVITEGTDKEQEVKKNITGVGSGAIGTYSTSEGILSKQARKRKLKREVAKQEKLEKKKKKLQLNGQGTFGKDKEQVRTSGEQRRRMKRFKRKRHKRKNDSESSTSHPVVKSGETSLIDESTPNNKENSAVLKIPKKGPGVNVSKSGKCIKQPVDAKTQLDGDASKSGDKLHDTDKDGEVDKNWKALMKVFFYFFSTYLFNVHLILRVGLWL